MIDKLLRGGLIVLLLIGVLAMAADTLLPMPRLTFDEQWARLLGQDAPQVTNAVLPGFVKPDPVSFAEFKSVFAPAKE